jgi:quercetin dioxygenase-like cupin family protein
MTSAVYSVVSDDRQALLAAAGISGERFQITRIFQGTGVTMIRIAFQAGQIMKEHSTSAPLVVQVLDGELAFRVGGDEITMPTGAILFVEPNAVHELEARQDTHVLLTLSTPV